MTRLVLLAFASYLFASLAYADLNLPAVLKSSDNYAQTLEKSKRTALGSSADLLQDAKNARSEDDLVGVVDAYEALAAKNAQSSGPGFALQKPGKRLRRLRATVLTRPINPTVWQNLVEKSFNRF